MLRAEDAKPEIVGVEVYTINTGLSEEKIEVRLLGEETQETIRGYLCAGIQRG